MMKKSRLVCSTVALLRRGISASNSGNNPPEPKRDDGDQHALSAEQYSKDLILRVGSGCEYQHAGHKHYDSKDRRKYHKEPCAIGAKGIQVRSIAFKGSIVIGWLSGRPRATVF